jgi:alkanesulfonate monooxygenase SsuD/methylene tetrahydromethanopterin reductase-like flavin-dependent oxidoreductase (luciferase family)
LGRLFDERLRLVELIERAGFAGYHMAEHHSTPLGMAASPSVFLSAAMQRTKTLRLGPLVYVLPLYHPLRLYEEICMLDHMSGGRLLVGVGRGGALLEHQRYGIDPTDAPAMYHEAFAVLMRAFDSEVLNFEGKYYRYKDYVVQAKPVQQPHPPLWFGGMAPPALNRLARLADGWIGAGSASTADFAEAHNVLREALVAEGRDAATFPVAKRVYIAVDDGRERARSSLRDWFKTFYGNPDLADRVAVFGAAGECVEGLTEVARAGAELIVLNPVFDEERQADILAAEVIPALTNGA